MAPLHDVDGGWAWVVLAAAYFNILLCSGLAYLGGVFQVVFLEQFGGSVSLTAWVTSLFSSLMQLAGPLSSAVSTSFSCRTSVMLGGCLISVGLFISALADNLAVLLFSFGLLSGTGLGLIYTSSIVVISFYFDKRRTLVNGLALSASGLGFILIPQLTLILFEEFSWRESLTILAGVAANSCVCGALMFSIHERDANKKRSEIKLFCKRNCFSTNENNDDIDHGVSCNNVEECELFDLKGENGNAQLPDSKSQSCIDSKYSLVSERSDFNCRATNNVAVEKCDCCEPFLYTNGEHNRQSKHTERQHLSKSHQLIQTIPLIKYQTDVLKPSCYSHGELSTRGCSHKTQIHDGTSSCGNLQTEENKKHRNGLNLSERQEGNQNYIFVSSNPSLISLVSSRRNIEMKELNSEEYFTNHADDNNIIRSQNFLNHTTVWTGQDRTTHVSSSCDSKLSHEKGNSRVQFPKLYKNRLFWVLCLCLFVSNAGCGVFNVHVPSFLKSQGLSVDEVTNVLSMNGVAILSGRCLVGALANSLPGNDLMFFMIMHIIGGLFMCLMPILGTSFIPNLLIIFGIGSYAGTVYAVLPTLTIQLVGLERLATAFGIEMVSAGVGYLLSPPIAGLLVDLTGGYEYNIMCGGLLFIAAGLVLMVIPGMEKPKSRQ